MIKQDSLIPLFAQVKDDIKHKIINNVYKYDEKLPTENEFCKIYEVSRITIRKAIEELEQEDFISKKQGKGTFVTYNKINTNIAYIDGFSYSFSEGTKKDRTSKVLSKIIILSDELLSKKLEIPLDTKLIELKRILIDKKVPVIIDTVYVEYDRFPLLFEEVTDNFSVYEFLHYNYNFIVSETYKEISACICNDEDSEILDCSQGEPLIDIFKVCFNENHDPVYISLLKVLTSRAVYSVSAFPN